MIELNLQSNYPSGCGLESLLRCVNNFWRSSLIIEAGWEGSTASLQHEMAPRCCVQYKDSGVERQREVLCTTLGCGAPLNEDS